MANIEKKIGDRLSGIGGYKGKCGCCGPAPQDRPAFRRVIRRKSKKLAFDTERKAEHER